MIGKRLFVPSVVCLLVCLSIAACGSDSTSGTGRSPTPLPYTPNAELAAAPARVLPADFKGDPVASKKMTAEEINDVIAYVMSLKQ